MMIKATMKLKKLNWWCW